MPSTGVDDPWRDGVGVMELTDTDLEASRNKSTRVADSSFELHRLVETLRRHEGLEDHSATCDRILRVELAYAIDEYNVSFERKDYDIKYTIPPVGWFEDQEFEHVDLVDEADVDTSDRTIGFSTPVVVHEMAMDAVDAGAYQTLGEIVRCGVERMLGR